MAMPASGLLGIINDPQAACSSICNAVFAATGVGSGSLTTLSVAAGKTAPHAMSEFYGYTAPTWSCIDLLRTNSAGTDGVSAAVLKVHCLRPNPAMSVGQCYTAGISMNLCAIGQAVGSFATLCATCNGVQVLCCTTTNGCITVTCNVTVDYNDILLICTGACAFNTACAGAAAAAVCLATITPVVGFECKGITCTYNCTWTA